MDPTFILFFFPFPLFTALSILNALLLIGNSSSCSAKQSQSEPPHCSFIFIKRRSSEANNEPDDDDEDDEETNSVHTEQIVHHLHLSIIAKTTVGSCRTAKDATKNTHRILRSQ